MRIIISTNKMHTETMKIAFTKLKISLLMPTTSASLSSSQHHHSSVYQHCSFCCLVQRWLLSPPPHPHSLLPSTKMSTQYHLATRMSPSLTGDKNLWRTRLNPNPNLVFGAAVEHTTRAPGLLRHAPHHLSRAASRAPNQRQVICTIWAGGAWIAHGVSPEHREFGDGDKEDREEERKDWLGDDLFPFYEVIRRDLNAKSTSITGSENPAKTQSAPRWQGHVGKRAPGGAMD
jgi:hypothetical protein